MTLSGTECTRRLEVRRKWAEVMRDYYSRVKMGDPLLAARTPDDQIRLVSYLFASTKQLDKVMRSIGVLWGQADPTTDCTDGKDLDPDPDADTGLK